MISATVLFASVLFAGSHGFVAVPDHVLASAVADAPAPAAPSIPKTPEGRHIQAFLAVLARPEPAAIREFVSAHYASSALAQLPLAARAERLAGIAADLGPLELVRVLAAGGGHAEFVAHSPRKNETLTITLDLDADSERRIRGARIEAGGPDPDDEPRAAPEKPKESDAAVSAAAAELLSSRAAKDEFSGVVVLAREGRPFFHQAYGLANRELSVPNTLDTRFNVASIGKVLTSAAIARLIRDGKLSPGDTIGKILPDSKLPSADRITVLQLLEMRSGLGDFFGPEYQATPKDRLRTLADYLPLFESKPLRFEPGKSREYSNAGYVVLGLIIEKISGQSYYDFVREHVLVPAGMTSTGWPGLDEIAPGRAVGYTRRGESGPSPDPARRSNIYTLPARGSSAGGGYSTAGDLLKLAVALSSGRLELAESAASGKSGGARHGADGFAGGSPGVNAILEIDYERKLQIIVLTNDDPPGAEKISRVLAQWMGMR
jgi:CubicO group peptidase (beta-lactamase class C family)